MNTRTVQRIIPSLPTSDGAGVKLRRSLGQSPRRAPRPVPDAGSILVRRRRTITSPASRRIRIAASRP